MTQLKYTSKIYIKNSLLRHLKTSVLQIQELFIFPSIQMFIQGNEVQFLFRWDM